MRTQEAAHWEIRKVMGDLLEKVKTIIPGIFDDFIEAEESDQNGLRYFEKRSM
jgi:thymidylate synthase ThyX